MPACYMLIGVPGSGKTTWINQQNFDWSRTVIASTDNYVERIAEQRNTTYTAVFDEVMPQAVRYMIDVVQSAVVSGHDIVWDQTSVTRHSRAKKFRLLPDYDVTAVVFSTPSRVELHKRLNGRAGKVIPISVLNAMIGSWEEPTLDEGFVEILHVENIYEHAYRENTSSDATTP